MRKINRFAGGWQPEAKVERTEKGRLGLQICGRGLDRERKIHLKNLFQWPVGLPTDQEATAGKGTGCGYLQMEDEQAVNDNSVASEGLRQAGASGPANREQDAIYQKGKLVARVVAPDLDLESKEIRFEEIVDSDGLNLADECEFQKYTIMIQKIALATKVDHREGRKGRTLAGCTAEILGYLEQ